MNQPLHSEIKKGGGAGSGIRYADSDDLSVAKGSPYLC